MRRKPDEEEDADERTNDGTMEGKEEDGGGSDLFRFDLTATPWKRVPTHTCAHRGEYSAYSI